MPCKNEILNKQDPVLSAGRVYLCVWLGQIASYKFWPFKWTFSGVGYHLIMVKDRHCDVKEISKMIKYHVPEARLESNVAAELSFILPKEYANRYGSREY